MGEEKQREGQFASSKQNPSQSRTQFTKESTANLSSLPANWRLSPLHLLAFISITVFITEVIIVLFLEHILEEFFHFQSHAIEGTVEAFLFAIFSSVFAFPVLYFFSFRPLVLHIKKRQQAEQQIHLQATALQAAANGIVITDHNGIIKWVNPAFAEMTGYTSEEVLGQNPRIFKSGQTDTQYYQQLWQTILTGQVWAGELINRRKDGTLYTEEQTIAPVRNEKGHVSHFIAIKQDISERKLIQAQLEKQHQEIRRRLQETATLAAINQSLNETLELEQVLQLITDAVPKLIGNVNRVVIHLLHEDEPVLYPAIWSGESEFGAPTLYLNPGEGIAGRAFAEGTLVNSPDVEKDACYIPHPLSGNYHSLMAAPLHSASRQLGTISMHSTRQNAFSPPDERLLTRLADSAAVAIETARLYLAERNQHQLAESLAKAAVALNHSLNLDEVLETILEQTFHIVDCDSIAIFLVKDNGPYLARARGNEIVMPALHESLRNMATNGRLSTIPSLQFMFETGKSILVSETKDNPNRPHSERLAEQHSFAAAPLRSGNQIIGFLNVYSKKPGFFNQRSIHRLEAIAAHAALAIQNANLYNDLETSLEQEHAMRAQLVQAGKLAAMGRMVASVAHELNNPLQTIKNCIFLSLKRSDPNSELFNYLGMALSETQRLSDLVSQLREVYRPGDGGPTQPLSVPKILDQVHLILNQHLQQHHVEWTQAAWPHEFRVVGVSNQLKQVFLNICLNAVEAMQPDGGTLCIGLITDPDTGQIGIQIQDTGPGIAPEYISQLFDPFFTTKDMGTGLGLSICYDIIQKHNGRITLDTQLNQGTTFTIWLPLIES